jgi:micrococcal nuclease
MGEHLKIFKIQSSYKIGKLRVKVSLAMAIVIAILIYISGYPVADQGLILFADKEDLAGMEKTVVTRVVDGDTIVIEGDIKVRLIGVDTPEVNGPSTDLEYYGEQASAYTKAALTDKTVYLDMDVSETDKYGRLLRYLYLDDGTFFNLKMVEDGYAYASTYPPDVKYAQVFKEAASAARDKSAGLWNK